MNQSFTPVRIGRHALPNRLVMAPMTRSRPTYDGTPGELAGEYYAQRASVGLIVTEGTQPSDDGQGYLATPWHPPRLRREVRCSPRKGCRTLPRRAR